MRLLSKEQVKTVEKKNKDVLAFEYAQLQASIEKAIKDLNDQKGQKVQELAILEARIDAVKMSHKSFVNQAQSEIAVLAKQREALSKPLVEQEQLLNQKAGKLTAVENTLLVKQYEIAERCRQVEERIKQSQAETAKATLAKEDAAKGIEQYEGVKAKVIEEKAEFFKKSEEFYKQKAEWETKYDTEMKAMTGRNRALDGYAQMLNDREETLNNLQKRIQSDRLALEAAKKEIYGRS